MKLVPLLLYYIYVGRRHSNLGHGSMGQVVFLPRPEIRGAFWAVISYYS